MQEVSNHLATHARTHTQHNTIRQCFSLNGSSRNDLTQALRVLAEMRNEGVKPNIFTYASLVNICER